MAQMTTPSIRLNDGIEIPQLGFGASHVLPEDTRELVEIALETGYRHIDITTSFDDESAIGAALAASGLPREDYFVAARLCDTELDRASTTSTSTCSTARP